MKRRNPLDKHKRHAYTHVYKNRNSRSKRLQASFVFVYYLINNKVEMIFKCSEHESDRGQNIRENCLLESFEFNRVHQSELIALDEPPRRSNRELPLKPALRAPAPWPIPRPACYVIRPVRANRKHRATTGITTRAFLTRERAHRTAINGNPRIIHTAYVLCNFHTDHCTYTHHTSHIVHLPSFALLYIFYIVFTE